MTPAPHVESLHVDELLARIERGEGPPPEQLKDAIRACWGDPAPDIEVGGEVIHIKSYEPGNTPDDLWPWLARLTP